MVLHRHISASWFYAGILHSVIKITETALAFYLKFLIYLIVCIFITIFAVALPDALPHREFTSAVILPVQAITVRTVLWNFCIHSFLKIGNKILHTLLRIFNPISFQFGCIFQWTDAKCRRKVVIPCLLLQSRRSLLIEVHNI